MPRLTIDGREVEIAEGATILDAARKLGIDVPALCWREGGRPSTSCMVCVVKVAGRRDLVPSCTAPAADGMVVESETDEVREARRTALELLLGDHLGDCEAPCQTICPASLNIPKMARAIRDGRLADAARIARDDLVLPASLGRICPAPCEKGCRRGALDEAVSIRLLHRFAADQAGLRAAGGSTPWHATTATFRSPLETAGGGKRVAIIGAGPAGLAAAYHLLRKGVACTVFDDHDRPGGMLRWGVEQTRLPRNVVDAETAVIGKMGAEFRLGVRVGRDVALDVLRREVGAIIVAVGECKEGDAERLGLAASKTGIQADRHTGRSSVEGVFVAGDAVRKSRMAVRSVGAGKAVAASVAEYLAGGPVAGVARRFSVHVGQVEKEEGRAFLAEASDRPRLTPSGGPDAGFTEAEAPAEAARCLHCDCRKPESCRLRLYAQQFDARTARYKGEERRRFVQNRGAGVIYEPGKCIDCGICIQIAEAAREPLGLTFIGRGFDVRVGVPFNGSLAEGLRTAAAACAAACPVGALSLENGEE